MGQPVHLFLQTMLPFPFRNKSGMPANCEDTIVDIGKFSYSLILSWTGLAGRMQERRCQSGARLRVKRLAQKLVAPNLSKINRFA